MVLRTPIFTLLASLAVLAPRSAGAQNRHEEADAPPTATARFAALSANAVIGGVTAGLLRALRGGSFEDAFLEGAGGGALAYAAKEIAARDVWGAGLLGRQLASLGGTMVADAGARRPLLSTLVFPLGPVRVHVDRRAGTWAPALDARSLGYLIAAIADERIHFDVSRSLSAGTTVFTTDRLIALADSGSTTGQTAGTLILLGGVEGGRRRPGLPALAAVAAHERVHVLQRDFVSSAWNDPLEAWVARTAPVARPAARFLDVDSAYLLLRLGLGSWLETRDLPWEIEAEMLEGLGLP